MDYNNYQTNDEPEIIIIDDAEETITTKENLKKPKTKKHHKRKVKLGKINDKMETLYITQKLNVKKTKFNCIINVNNVPKKKKKGIHRSSIIRSSRNECKREAYYNRIVPICTRRNCFSGALPGMECCRTARNGEYRIGKTDLKLAIKRSGMLSPVSSGPLPDSLDISYEDVSDKSFSSEDELDTLIKRTKQRENQFIFSMKANSAPLSSTPNPVSEEATSTYSGGSLHSTSTLLLRPLETEAYSPTTSPGYMHNVSGPYSPTMTSDWINYGLMDPIESPYSPSDPTKTPIINEDDKHEDRKTGNGVKANQYSPATPPYIETIEQHKNRNHDKHDIYNKQNGRVVATKMNGSHYIKVENIKREEESENEDSINNEQSSKSEINENNNIIIKTEKIKRENENTCDINENFEGVVVKVEKP